MSLYGFKGNQKAAKWSNGLTYLKLKKASEIQQARPTEACGKVKSVKKWLKVYQNTIVIVQYY